MIYTTLFQISYSIVGLGVALLLVINYLTGPSGPGGEEDQDPPLPPLPKPPEGPITGGPTEDREIVYDSEGGDAIGQLLEEYNKEYNSDQPVCHDMQVA